MDRHEKGIEKMPGRLDRPLPEWNGSWRRSAAAARGGQKLAAGRPLTAGEG
jgi:hypothetical protein